MSKLWSAGQRRPSISELTVSVDVDRPLAELAWQLKIATPGRLPLVDAVIAATPRATDAILVHRDPHMAAIPRGLVRQMMLTGA